MVIIIILLKLFWSVGIKLCLSIFCCKLIKMNCYKCVCVNSVDSEVFMSLFGVAFPTTNFPKRRTTLEFSNLTFWVVNIWQVNMWPGNTYKFLHTRTYLVCSWFCRTQLRSPSFTIASSRANVYSRRSLRAWRDSILQINWHSINLISWSTALTCFYYQHWDVQSQALLLILTDANCADRIINLAYAYADSQCNQIKFLLFFSFGCSD